MAAVLHLDPRPTPGRPTLTLLPGGAATRRPRPALPVGLAVVALIVAVLLAVAAVAVGRGALAGMAPAPAEPPAAVTGSSGAAATGADTVVVRPGDSLWSVARRLQPTGDVRPLVDRLAAANGAALVPGQRLVIPD